MSASQRFLDLGAGMGGPAGWLRAHYATEPFTIERMVPAATAARSLFGLHALAGDAEDIPLASSSIDAAWVLAVLDTSSRPAVVLRELRRVLVPGGHLGVLEYVATTA